MKPIHIQIVIEVCGEQPQAFTLSRNKKGAWSMASFVWQNETLEPDYTLTPDGPGSGVVMRQAPERAKAQMKKVS